LSIKGIHEVAFTIPHNTSMKLLGSNAVFDSWMRVNILRKKSNQKALVGLAKFHLQNGFVLKEHGNLDLHEACRVKKRIIVDFLIEAGADVNFRDAQDQTALNFAIPLFDWGAHTGVPHVCKLVEKLIQQGASLSVQDNSGRSLLHQWAFDLCFNVTNRVHKKAILARLLHNNVPVDLVDSDGNTALMYAAAHSTGWFLMLLEAAKEHAPRGSQGACSGVSRV